MPQCVPGNRDRYTGDPTAARMNHAMRITESLGLTLCYRPAELAKNPADKPSRADKRLLASPGRF
jgi:hypothetical protein